jgi:HEAT repeat protein
MAVSLGWALPASGDQFPADPVESLRKALRAAPSQALNIQDPDLLKRLENAKTEERFKIQNEALERTLMRKVEAIHQIGDLRRALLLQEWPQESLTADDQLGPVEGRVRQKLADRFRSGVREVLRTGDLTARLAVMNMLADIGATLFNPEPSQSKRSGAQELRELRARGEGLAPDLADVVLHGKTREDREAAAYALGMILPDPKIAVPALQTMLGAPDVQERRAAAGGLTSLVRVVSQLSAKGTTFGPQAGRSDIVNAAASVVPAVSRGLTDSDALVRRLSAEAMELAASALSNQVPQPQPTEFPTDSETDRKLLEEARAELMPLMRALGDQGTALGKAVLDSDATVRLRARRALEEMGLSRQRFMTAPGGSGTGSSGYTPQGAKSNRQRHDIVLVSGQSQKKAESEDPLLAGLTASLSDLARGVQDPDVQNRLAALDAIETIGHAAAPAAPALVRAFRDTDRFVRWAAARAMGKVGPVNPSVEVPALAQLLNDQDVDVYRAAAVSLERYGPLAREAVPLLIRALKADHWVMRIQAIETLESIGTGAAPAIPGLAESLSDPDTRVRRYAAELLGKFGPTAKDAVPALQQALGDPNVDVRKAASDALLSIVAPQGK